MIANGKQRLTGSVIQRPLTSEQVQAIETGAKYLYLVGAATYADEFCSYRELRFCARYRPGALAITCESGYFELPCGKLAEKEPTLK